LQSDVRKDYSRSMLISAEDAQSAIRPALELLHRVGLSDMRSEGFDDASVQLLDSVDLRYRGQSYELNVPFADDFVSSFHKLHERRYGHSDATRAVELVNVRSTLIGRAPKIELPRMKKTRTSARPLETVGAWLEGKEQKTAVYDRSSLSYGHKFDGPAIVGEYSATTLVPPGYVCEVDAFGNLVLERV
jgi:N-methylhydantoinase A